MIDDGELIVLDDDDDDEPVFKPKKGELHFFPVVQPVHFSRKIPCSQLFVEQDEKDAPS